MASFFINIVQRIPPNRSYGYPIFKWTVVTWNKDKAPELAFLVLVVRVTEKNEERQFILTRNQNTIKSLNVKSFQLYRIGLPDLLLMRYMKVKYSWMGIKSHRNQLVSLTNKQFLITPNQKSQQSQVSQITHQPTQITPQPTISYHSRPRVPYITLNQQF